MSFPDSFIEPGLELLTDLEVSELANRKPLDAKKALAFEIVKQIYGQSEAEKAKKEFERVFQKKDLPSEIPVVSVKEESLPLLDLVFTTKGIASRSEAKRLIAQSAIEVDGKILTDPNEEVKVSEDVVIRIGKTRFFKVKRK